MAESSDKKKGKNSHIKDKHSGEQVSTRNSANAPSETILCVVHNKNQQAEFAEKKVNTKDDINILKAQIPFIIES